jgi:K+-transporting ATPase ATPase C chain
MRSFEPGPKAAAPGAGPGRGSTVALLRSVAAVTFGLWLLLGLAYPLATTAVSAILFPFQAAGSPLTRHGSVVAARNVGQEFSAPGLFWGRPSATVSPATGKADPYDAESSGPSNLAPTNPALINAVRARTRQLLRDDPGLKIRQIPPDLVESSGSGLDPDISPNAAAIQVPRVSRATGLSPARLRNLIRAATVGPQFGILGAPAVNVVLLNLSVVRAERHRAR